LTKISVKRLLSWLATVTRPYRHWFVKGYFYSYVVTVYEKRKNHY
jgi:hypothetical protein